MCSTNYGDSMDALSRSWLAKPRDQCERWTAELVCIPASIAAYLLVPVSVTTALTVSISVGWLYLSAFAWWQQRRTPMSTISCGAEPVSAGLRDDEGAPARGGCLRQFLPAFVY